MALPPFQTSNNSTGLYLPEDTSRDISAFEQPDKPGFLEGFAFSANDALGNNPVINLAELAQQGIAKKFAPGKLLTKSGWESSEFFRPNLSFDALKTGDDSISESVARLAAERLDGDAATDARLNTMEPGFLSGATRFVGETIGFVMDPLNIAAFKGANLIVGKGNSLLLQKLGETRFARTRTAAFGAAEGAFITIPQAAIAFQTDKVFGQDPSAMAAIATVGLNAGLGGIIRGVFGFKEPITHASYRNAMETAANQMSAGKSVDVGPIVENGYRDQRLKEDGEQEASNRKARMEQHVKRQANKKIIEDFQSKLEKAEDRLKFNEQLKGKLKTGKPIDAKTMIAKAEEILGKPAFDRTALDRLFLKQLPVNEEIKRAVDILIQPSDFVNAEDQQFLVDMLRGKEKFIIKNRIEAHEGEIEKIKSKLDVPSAVEDGERLNRELDAFKEKISNANARLFDLGTKRKTTPEIEKIKKQIRQAKEEGKTFDKVIQHHEAEAQINNNKGDAVDHAELSASAKKLQSWEGDSVVLKEANEALNRQVDSISDNPEIAGLKDVEDAVKELELSPEDKLELEKGKEIQEDLEIMKKAILETAECLIRTAT